MLIFQNKKSVKVPHGIEIRLQSVPKTTTPKPKSSTNSSSMLFRLPVVCQRLGLGFSSTRYSQAEIVLCWLYEMNQIHHSSLGIHVDANEHFLFGKCHTYCM